MGPQVSSRRHCTIVSVNIVPKQVSSNRNQAYNTYPHYRWALLDDVRPHLGQEGGRGKEKTFDTGWDIFFGGDPPRAGGYQKKWVLQKKLFLPMSHVPHMITVFPPHNMPLALVGIPLGGP